MTTNSKQKEEKFYNFFYNNLRVTKPFNFLEIDFNKPWHDVFFQIKWSIFLTFVFSGIRNLFFTLIPIFFGYIFSSGNYNLFYVFFAISIFIQIFAFFINPLWIKLYSQVIGSVKFAAQNFFLKADPIAHSTRSSGQIISKVSRGSTAYDEILFLVTEDIFPILVQSVAAASTLFLINIYLGFIGFAFVTFTIAVSTVLNVRVEKEIEPKVIETVDLDKQVEVENLAQVQLIRSIFATEIQIDKANRTSQKAWSNINLKWRMHHFAGQILSHIFFTFLAAIYYYVLLLISKGEVSSSLGLSVLISITLNLIEINWIGNKVEKLIKSGIEAQDLFEFIRNFGKQTYPVLDNEQLIVNND